jgi:hypothetical protein
MSPRAEHAVAGCPRCALRRGGVAAALTVGLLLGGAGLSLATTPTTPTGPPRPTASAPATTGESWAAELAVDGGDDSGLALSDGGVRLAAPSAAGRAAEGVLTLAPRRLAAPTSALAGELIAEVPPGTGVDVQARGLDRRGAWGDWIALRAGRPARFAVPTVDVQVRLLIHGSVTGATPVVREIWLTALGVPAPPRPAPPKPTTTQPRPTPPKSSTTRPTTTRPAPPRPTTTRPTPPTKPVPPPTSRPVPPTKPAPPTRPVPPTRPAPPAPPKPTTTAPTTTTTTPPPPLAQVPPVAAKIVPALGPAKTTTTPPPTTTTTPPTTTTTTTTTAAPPTTTTPKTTTPTPTPTTTTATPVVPAVKELWNGAIATTGLKGFKSTPYNITGGASVKVVGGASKAIRFTVPAGSQRAEIEPNVGELTEGQTRYFRLTYVLPTSFPVDPQGFQLATQWKNEGDGSPPLELRIEKGKFVLGGGYARPGGSRLFAQDVAPAITGRPVDIVVGIAFSSDPAKGRVDMWIDGQQKLTDFRPPGGTLYPGKSSYWKIGLYRDTANRSTATADLTAAALGKSYDAVS